MLLPGATGAGAAIIAGVAIIAACEIPYSGRVGRPEESPVATASKLPSGL